MSTKERMGAQHEIDCGRAKEGAGALIGSERVKEEGRERKLKGKEWMDELDAKEEAAQERKREATAQAKLYKEQIAEQTLEPV